MWTILSSMHQSASKFMYEWSNTCHVLAEGRFGDHSQGRPHSIYKISRLIDLKPSHGQQLLFQVTFLQIPSACAKCPHS
jgi:hypothetical protein